MTNTTPLAPRGWLEFLEESEAEAEAGLSVPGEVVRQDLLDALARVKAKRDQQRVRGTTARRR